jgi:hypothetical protein
VASADLVEGLKRALERIEREHQSGLCKDLVRGLQHPPHQQPVDL